MSALTNDPNRRRSTRIRKNQSQSSKQSINISSQNSNNNRRNGTAIIKNIRYSGRKRSKPDSDDDDDEDQAEEEETVSSSSSSEEDDNNNNNNNSNQNGNIHHNQNGPQLTHNQNAQNTRNGAKRRRLQYAKISNFDQKNWAKNNTHNNGPTLRRSIRLKYRELADSTADARADIVDPMQSKFFDSLHEQNKIFEKVTHPAEAFQDIAQANVMSALLKEQTNALKNEQFTISSADLIKSIKNKFGINNNNNDGSQSDSDDDNNLNEPTKINWASYGQSMAQWFLSVPAISFMNGPLQQCEITQIEQKKKRVPRKRVDFKAEGELVKAKKITKQRKADKTETKSRINHLRKELKKKCRDQEEGVNPFPFVINPNSYSQTIENLFDLSFVMKEGFAAMMVDDDTDQPVLSFVSRDEKSQRTEEMKQSNHKSNGQCIVKFNPQTFNQLINAYDITESQIERADEGADDDDEEEEEEEELKSEQPKKMKVKSQSGKRGRGGGIKKKKNDKEEAE